MNTSGKDISAALGAILPRVVSLRQQLHQIPELMYQEVKTAGLIRQYCASFGLKCQTVPEGCPTATYVMIGDPALPCVALRADIDALPIQEETQVAYRSGHAGYMHACGHDGHAAALVGAGAVLQQFAQAMPVCVKLIWQPAEEGGGGARRLVDAGILDGRLGPKVRAIFGLHGWPGLPVGNIATRPGPLMASVDNFHAMFVGRGAHGAFPHLGRDPIVAAAEAVLGLQQIISRELDPVAPAVITVGQISGGSAVNIIPSTATIAGTSRAITPETREYIKEAIERRLKGIAAAHDLRLELKWTEGYPPTINDPGLTEYGQPAAPAP